MGTEFFQPNQSGRIYPTGALPNIRGGNGGVNLHQTVNIDASGVNPEGYTRSILGIVRRETGQAFRESSKATLSAEPGHLRQTQTLKG